MKCSNMGHLESWISKKLLCHQDTSLLVHRKQTILFCMMNTGCKQEDLTNTGR